MTDQFDCPRCEGKGEIPAFRNVQGGVCFKCGGCGKTATRPAKASTKWLCVYAGREAFTIKARTAAEALRAAIARIDPKYPMFAGVTPEQVEVRPV